MVSTSTDSEHLTPLTFTTKLIMWSLLGTFNQSFLDFQSRVEILGFCL